MSENFICTTLSEKDYHFALFVIPPDVLEKELDALPENEAVVSSVWHAKIAVAKLLNLYPLRHPYLISKTGRKIFVIWVPGAPEIFKVTDLGAEMYIVVTYDTQKKLYTLAGWAKRDKVHTPNDQDAHLWMADLSPFAPDMIYHLED